MDRYRYPGLRSFEEEDEMLFFGRDSESAQLASIIYSERFVVLFGNSGVGKSSLLNTLYKKNEILSSFEPIRIRIQAKQITDNGQDINPLEIVKDELEAFFEKKGINFDPEKILFNKKKPSLWEWVKLAEKILAEEIQEKKLLFLKELEYKQLKEKLLEERLLAEKPEEEKLIGENALVERLLNEKREAEKWFMENNPVSTLVLVFDQFEEFFLLQPDIQNKFSHELSEVLHEQPPARILDWMAKKEDNKRTDEIFQWYAQASTRVVFSIRSDKLYHMGSMINYIPIILSSRMELKHFDKDNAIEAIKNPAALDVKSGVFISPIIDFKGNIPESIAKAVTNDAGEVDSSLLQVICYSVEEKIIAKKPKIDEPYSLSEEEFNAEINLEEILEGFYLTQTGKFDAKDVDFIRRVIEDNFVENDERVALSEQQLITRLNNRKDLIQQLIAYRLLREELTAGKKLKYELIHDKLIATIQRRKELRKKADTIRQEALDERNKIDKKNRIITRTIAFVTISIFAIGLYFTAANSINSRLVDKINNSYKTANHFIAYKYLQELKNNKFYNYNTHNLTIKEFKNKFFYDISGGDKIVVIDNSTVAVHNFDQTIYVWKVNKKNFQGNSKLKLQCILPNALNMVVAPVDQYLAYRDTGGVVNVYDIKKDKLHRIIQSKVNLFSIGKNNSDYKMAFLNKSSWLIYIDKKLNFKLYNVHNDSIYSFSSNANKYEARNALKFFYHSPGSNIIGSKPPERDWMKIWRMGKKAERIAVIENIDTIFTTSRASEFAYLTKDGTVFTYKFNTNLPPKQIAKNVKNIIPLKDGSKVVLIFDDHLKGYDLSKDEYDPKFDLNNKFYKRLERNDMLYNRQNIKWTPSGNKLIFVKENAMVDLDKVESFSLIPTDIDIPQLANPDGSKIIVSDVNDEFKLAYINQFRQLVVKRIGSNPKDYGRWPLLSEENFSYIKSTYRLDEICKFSTSGRYLAFVNPEVEKDRLTIVDLKTGKKTRQKFAAKIIGNYFTDNYIHIISDFNTAGGLFFINQKDRDDDYYEQMFPTLTDSDKKIINF